MKWDTLYSETEPKYAFNNMCSMKEENQENSLLNLSLKFYGSSCAKREGKKTKW